MPTLVGVHIVNLRHAHARFVGMGLVLVTGLWLCASYYLYMPIFSEKGNFTLFSTGLAGIKLITLYL